MNTTIVPLRLQAHCSDAFCAGNAQQEVDGERETVEVAVGDMYGEFKAPTDFLTENSRVYYRAADDVAACPHCGKPRELTEQVRPTYAFMSGHSQSGLLKMRKGFTRDNWVAPSGAMDGMLVQAAPKDDTEAQLREMRAEIAALRASQALAEGAETPAELPTGVRARGAGYQAFWRADGKQQQHGGFETPEEAAEYRAAQLGEGI